MDLHVESTKKGGFEDDKRAKRGRESGYRLFCSRFRNIWGHHGYLFSLNDPKISPFIASGNNQR